MMHDDDADDDDDANDDDDLHRYSWDRPNETFATVHCWHHCAGVFLTSVFITAFCPARGDARAKGETEVRHPSEGFPEVRCSVWNFWIRGIHQQSQVIFLPAGRIFLSFLFFRIPLKFKPPRAQKEEEEEEEEEENYWNCSVGQLWRLDSEPSSCAIDID